MTEKFSVEWQPRALKALKKIDPSHRLKLFRASQALAINPHPVSAMRLVGVDDIFRIRVGDFRLLYTVENDLLLVLVVTVGHRRDVYRALPE